MQTVEEVARARQDPKREVEVEMIQVQCASKESIHSTAETQSSKAV